MKKKQILLLAFFLGIIFAGSFFIKSNSKALLLYETQSIAIKNLENKIVATGKVIPENEVEIKPQIAGIVDKILVEEGEKVKSGDLLAIIKVVPNEQTLNSAEGRLKNANIILKNAEVELARNQILFDKGVISEQEYNSIELNFDQATQSLSLIHI